MDQQVNPYDAPREAVPERSPFPWRRAAKRFLLVAWLLTLGALVFSVFHAADRDPLQWSSAMLGTICLMFSLLLTLIYWLVVLVSPWFARHLDQFDTTQDDPR